MTSYVLQTGMVVPAREADAWHAEIRRIMSERSLNFGPAVDYYIRRKAGQQSAAEYVAPETDAA